MTDRLLFRMLHTTPAPVLPMKATNGAAYMDVCAYLPDGHVVTMYTHLNDKRLVAVEGIYGGLVLAPGHRALIPTGWAVKCPPETSLRIYSRSGLALKEGLILPHSVGIVDSDYRNEVFVTLMNTSAEAVLIKHEQRIAQAELVVGWEPHISVVQADDASWFDTDRKGGFGSTGS